MTFRFHSIGRFFLVLFIGLIFSVLQYSLMPMAFSPYVLPDICFLFFIALASRYPPLTAALWGMMLGFWIGIFSGTGYVYVFTWPVIGWLIPGMSQGVNVRRFLPTAVTSSLVLFVAKLLSLVVLALGNFNVEDKWWRILSYLPQAGVAFVVGPFMFRFVNWLPFLREEESTRSAVPVMLWKGRIT